MPAQDVANRKTVDGEEARGGSDSTIDLAPTSIMPRIRRILFATDFSKASVKAFDTAVTLAKANGATLILLHAIPPLTPIMPEQPIGDHTWEQIDLRGRQWAKEQLARLAQKATNAGIHATSALTDGEPARQIVRMVRAKKADLLVVGTHGRTGLTKFFLGSVAARVVATAPCPVVTVRGT